MSYARPETSCHLLTLQPIPANKHTRVPSRPAIQHNLLLPTRLHTILHHHQPKPSLGCQRRGRRKRQAKKRKKEKKGAPPETAPQRYTTPDSIAISSRDIPFFQAPDRVDLGLSPFFHLFAKADAAGGHPRSQIGCISHEATFHARRVQLLTALFVASPCPSHLAHCHGPRQQRETLSQTHLIYHHVNKVPSRVSIT